MLKTYLGIKNPQVYEPQEKRLEYYKTFYEGKTQNTEIYTITDSATLIKSFKTLRIPRIYVKNTVTDTIYVLSCYDNIVWDVENINNGKLKEVNKADTLEFGKMLRTLKNDTQKTFATNENATGIWEVFLVDGVFMGKKLKNRTLPVTQINELKAIKILDLSVDKK